MAKIGNLQVSRIKIASGALSTTYEATGTTTIHLTVSYASNNPTVFFIRGRGSLASLVRDRDSRIIGTVAGTNFPDTPRLIASFLFDGDPQNGDSYTVSGMSNVAGNTLTALVRLK